MYNSASDEAKNIYFIIIFFPTWYGHGIFSLQPTSRRGSYINAAVAYNRQCLNNISALSGDQVLKDH